MSVGNAMSALMRAAFALLLVVGPSCCRNEPEAPRRPEQSGAGAVSSEKGSARAGDKEVPAAVPVVPVAPAVPEVETPEPPCRECDVLLTGYEPFGGVPFNSSWEAIKELEGAEIKGKRVRTAMLPVVWVEASEKLREAVRQKRPDVVVCFGMGTEHIQIELTARNERRPYPDNKKQPPPSRFVIEDGDPIMYTKLPWREIQKRLKEAGLECVTSHDAGGYLCNEAFYTCMAEAEALKIKVAGFVHVPVAEPGSNALDDLEKAVRIIVETCLAE